MNHDDIIDDPSEYGSKGQIWNPDFVAYMKAIVTHPVYEGMPDAVKDDGKIQWEAPSNRSGGKYQNTHHKRRDWWRAKAASVGIDTNVDQWISRTAKTIHPTGEKPCKRCGRILQIAYTYPKSALIDRLHKAFGDDFEIDELEPITEVVQRLVDVYGDESLDSLSKLFKTSHITPPDLGRDIDKWISWLEDDYIPSEPSMLSPGVMSNAPDRFDGFHSFNKCCRGQADTGRHAANLRSYTTDRRVFEYWSEGDWIAADRLMGLVKSKLRDCDCADGGKGPPSADHIGPLSLGFCHRPVFHLLSKAANSAKNNRMTLWDVEYLIDAEKNDEHVASWYAKPLWDMRKAEINDEEKALRISKLLRDNQRNAMRILCQLHDAGLYSFLAYLLELGYADNKVEFDNLRSDKFITTYDAITYNHRDTKYSKEQKARRIRIGFEALRTYKEKDNRHSFAVSADEVDKEAEKAIELLKSSKNDYLKLDNQLSNVLYPEEGAFSEEKLRALVESIPTDHVEIFEEAKKILANAMSIVATGLNDMWDSERYVRVEFTY